MAEANRGEGVQCAHMVKGTHVSARRQVNFLGCPDRRGSHLCDEEASAFLLPWHILFIGRGGRSHLGIPSSHNDRRPLAHQNVRCAVFHLCSILVPPSVVLQLCLPSILQRPIDKLSTPSVVGLALYMRKHVGESEKAQVPQGGGAERKRMQHDRHLSQRMHRLRTSTAIIWMHVQPVACLPVIPSA